LYFHALGTSQDEDVLVYERPDQPDWGFSADVTEDGRFLLVYQSEGTEPRNRIFVKDLSDPASAVAPFLDAFDAAYAVAGNDGERFYVKTDKNAPRGRLVAIDLHAPAADRWEVLVPEAPGRDVLSSVTMVANRFVAVWQVDARQQMKVYAIDGGHEGDIALPGIGSIPGLTGRRDHTEFFYAFTSFTYPTTIFRYTVPAAESFLFKRPRVPFDATKYETRQVFYASKDGTRVPMFITYRKGLPLDGRNPTYLYGYGGFNISLTPTFNRSMYLWMEHGGIYAVANLRGGSEFGEDWHRAGMLEKKQNVFNDFIAAGEFLIAQKYTDRDHLAIQGGSNGGLLMGAMITQRPDLFRAVVCAVPLLDMLRYQNFQIAKLWIPEYGSAEDPKQFEWLYAYSPYHHVKPGEEYPAILFMTGDTDTRVDPMHAKKMAALMQAEAKNGASKERPILLRIETKAGHGQGKPVTKQIEENTDMYSFLFWQLGVKP